MLFVGCQTAQIVPPQKFTLEANSKELLSKGKFDVRKEMARRRY